MKNSIRFRTLLQLLSLVILIAGSQFSTKAVAEDSAGPFQIGTWYSISRGATFSSSGARVTIDWKYQNSGAFRNLFDAAGKSTYQGLVDHSQSLTQGTKSIMSDLSFYAFDDQDITLRFRFTAGSQSISSIVNVDLRGPRPDIIRQGTVTEGESQTLSASFRLPPETAPGAVNFVWRYKGETDFKDIKLFEGDYQILVKNEGRANLSARISITPGSDRDLEVGFEWVNFYGFPIYTIFSLTVEPAQNTDPSFRYDVNGDGVISPLDALLVINALSPNTPYELRLDINQDGFISPLDALLVINQL